MISGCFLSEVTVETENTAIGEAVFSFSSFIESIQFYLRNTLPINP
jgi:hypothetical protein